MFEIKGADTRVARRCKVLGAALNSEDKLDPELDAMKLLRKVRNSTIWSVIYESGTCIGTVGVDENFKTLYRFGFN